MKNILIIDDDKNFSEAVKEFLERNGFKTSLFFSLKEALNLKERFDLILLDLILKDGNGIDYIDKFLRFSELIIVITGVYDISMAVKAIKKGAIDYVVKPVDLEALLMKIKSYLLLTNIDEPSEIVGNSPSIREVKRIIRTVARHNLPVLIIGETGTGKELVARAIHRLSGRKGKFVDVNCGAIVDTLFESEFFGYRKGAFTGANYNKEGLFLVADKGTLFLDEITELSKPFQGKFLRVLENKEFREVGGTENIKVNVRIISATNLKYSHLRKKLRSDLFFRLSTFIIEIPPLRERKEDIEPLVKFFLKGRKKISDEVMNLFLSYHWPGNVRELKNEIERDIVVAKGDTIRIEDVSERLREVKVRRLKSLEEMERDYIRMVLRICGGNKTKAAKILGISRFTLRKKLKEN